MKLWQELKNKPFCNDIHFFLIALAIFLLSLKYWFFYFVLAIYGIFLLKKTKYFWYILVLCLIVFFVLLFEKTPKDLSKQESYEAEIEEVYSDYYVLKINNLKVKAYAKEIVFSPGTVIECQIQINSIKEKNYETDFDYQEYLLSKGISYQCFITDAKEVNKQFNINYVKYYFDQYLKANLSSDSYTYVKTMVLGINDLSDELKDGYSALGISHILAISGLHILFLFKVFVFINEKLFKIYSKLTPTIFIIIYVTFLGFPASALRALLFILIGQLNKYGDNRYSRLDILSISFIIMVLINPLSFYQTGFILSYLVSFCLIFLDEFVKELSKLKKMYFSYLFIYFCTLPFLINMTNEISFLSIIFSPILGIILGYLLLPLCFILALLPFFDSIFKYVFQLLNNYIIGITKMNLTIAVPDQSYIVIFIYYLLFVFLIIGLLKKRKVFLKLMLFSFNIFFLAIERNLTPFFKVTFIAVGQGDCAVIEYPNNEGVIVIDAFNSLDYLKSLGIKKIDCLIISHSDIDHIRDAPDLISTFQIKNIYYPLVDSECKDYFSNVEAIPVNYLNSFSFKNIEYQFIAPIKTYEDKNSNSLVVKVTIFSKTFLFCGDMTVEEETDLLKQNTYIKADVLKAGHHGSKSSSSLEFLKAVSPEYSVISVGPNNKYHLPDQIVVDRLDSISKVYNTACNGNITFYLYNEKIFVHTYR